MLACVRDRLHLEIPRRDQERAFLPPSSVAIILTRPCLCSAPSRKPRRKCFHVSFDGLSTHLRTQTVRRRRHGGPPRRARRDQRGCFRLALRSGEGVDGRNQGGSCGLDSRRGQWTRNQSKRTGREPGSCNCTILSRCCICTHQTLLLASYLSISFFNVE